VAIERNWNRWTDLKNSASCEENLGGADLIMLFFIYRAQIYRGYFLICKYHAR